MTDWRKISYAELVANIGNDQYLQVNGPSETEYQLEFQFVRGDKNALIAYLKTF